MSAFIVFDNVTGSVVRSGNCPAEHIANQATEAGTTAMMVDSKVMPDEWFWDGNALVPRAPLGADFDTLNIDADGVDVATLAPLPIPVDVHVDGVAYEVTDGSFELSLSAPGSYYVLINEPGYLIQSWRVTAT